MGWGRTFFLGDIGNRLDIGDVEDEVARVRRDLQTFGRNDAAQDKHIDDLLRENAELKLYLAAIVRLLMAKQVISKDELEKIVDQLDAADGSMDGKYKGSVT